jgi:hypothetical protein
VGFERDSRGGGDVERSGLDTVEEAFLAESPRAFLHVVNCGGGKEGTGKGEGHDRGSKLHVPKALEGRVTVHSVCLGSPSSSSSQSPGSSSLVDKHGHALMPGSPVVPWDTFVGSLEGLPPGQRPVWLRIDAGGFEVRVSIRVRPSWHGKLCRPPRFLRLQKPLLCPNETGDGW